jgi:hypothetical protein
MAEALLYAREFTSESGEQLQSRCGTSTTTTTGRTAAPTASRQPHGFIEVSSTSSPLTDVLELVIGVVALALAASAHNNTAGGTLLDQAAERCGNRLEKALVDQEFKDEVVIHGTMLDITVDVVRRNPADHGKGFVPDPKIWVVKQVKSTAR